MVVIICVVFLGTLAARAIFNQQCLRVYELSARWKIKKPLKSSGKSILKMKSFRLISGI